MPDYSMAGATDDVCGRRYDFEPLLMPDAAHASRLDDCALDGAPAAIIRALETWTPGRRRMPPTSPHWMRRRRVGSLAGE